MRQRIPQLDGLRALAIIAVFVGHALRVRMMWIGVDLFFVLSGFLITGILLDAPKTSFRSYLAHFYERRARRILPPYILVLIFASVFFGVAWARHWWLFLGLMNYSGFYWREPSVPALAPLWSLAVEEQFYFVWPLAVFFIKPRHLPRLLIASLFLAPMLRAAFTPWLAHQSFDTYHWVIYRSTPFRFDCLAMGALLTFVWRAYSEKIRRYGHLGLIMVAITPPLVLALAHHFAGFSTYGTSVLANVLLYEISLFAVTGAVLWALSGRYTQVLELGLMRWLARLSYSFYLVHESMLELATRYVHSKGTIALLAGAASLLYAQLSWRFLEKPILSGGSTKVATREAEAAQPHDAAEAQASLRLS